MGNPKAYIRPNNAIKLKKSYLRKTRKLYIKGVNVKSKKQIPVKPSDT